MMGSRPRRINRTARDYEVGASVIVEIDEAGAPLHRASFAGEPCRYGYIGKKSLAVVVVEAGRLVRKICLHYIEKTVAVVVNGISAHPALRSAIRIIGYTRKHAALAKSAVPVIHEEQTRCRIVGDVDIRPSIIVIVTNTGSEAKSGCCPVNPCSFGHICKSP